MVRSRRTWRSVGMAGLMAWGLLAATLRAQPPAQEVPNPFPERVKAVDLDGGREWLNAAGPISLKDLRGKVVLLDFWTYCCINCMHVLPDLAYLEAKYPNELVVIGVHSAKFENEKESDNIRKAILRYEIAHPVVNDADMILWRKFQVRAWPTLVVIDPEGYYCGYVSGEGHRDLLEQVVERLIAHHRWKNTLDETPIHFDLERAKQAPTPLRFPGKVLADAASNRLFISDSNHNRIVVTTLDGQLLDVIGSGRIGKADGDYAAAEFDHPQGMALVADKLFVADTENHLIRMVDLTAKQVRTYAGTGEQGHRRSGSGPLRETAIASPWDLLVLDNVLYIAMAGPHQIWSHKLGEDAIQPYAGNGGEDIRNGPLDEAELAQPSGLATDGRFVYICDSEGSAIRKMTTKPDNNLRRPTGSLTTIAGTSDLPNGRSLFEFGDIDGPVEVARLQHPLGIVHHDGVLYVADTYNHKLKRINPTTKTTETWLTGADPQAGIVPPNFSEPAGLAIAGNTLFVADTNHHRICAVDLSTKAMRVLEIPGLTPPAVTSSASTETTGTALELPPQRVAPGEKVTFRVTLELPVEHKLNPAGAITFLARGEAAGILDPAALGERDEAIGEGTTVTFTLPLTAQPGQTTLDLALTYTYCREGAGGVCRLGTLRWNVPLEVTPDATGTEITLPFRAAAQ